VAIKEKQPRTLPGSIHCPVRCMKGIIATGNPEAIAHMIRQLRAAYADPATSDHDKAGHLWLGRRYQAAYAKLTGAPLPSNPMKGH
jgi:hypothetical protein